MSWQNGCIASLFLSAAVSLTGCDERASADPRTKARLVRSVIVQTASPESQVLTGIVRARIESDVGFRVGGKIVERLVDAGDPVSAGQVLMRLDPTDLDLQAAAAAAQLVAAERTVAAARAQSVRARADEVRSRSLAASGWTSTQAYEQSRASADAGAAQLAAAQAQADAARAAAAAAQRQLAYAVLRADRDGTIMATLAEPSQVVAAGAPVLRLAQDGPREIEVQVPETRLAALPNLAEAVLYNRPGVLYPATLRSIGAAADPVTRTYDARYVFGGEAATAPLGSTATLTFKQAGALPIMVPLAALFDDGHGAGVWVIDPQTLALARHPVIVAALGEEQAAVSGGLDGGERVVSLGPQHLHAGEIVRLERQ